MSKVYKLPQSHQVALYNVKMAIMNARALANHRASFTLKLKRDIIALVYKHNMMPSYVCEYLDITLKAYSRYKKDYDAGLYNTENAISVTRKKVEPVTNGHTLEELIEIRNTAKAEIEELKARLESCESQLNKVNADIAKELGL